MNLDTAAIGGLIGGFIGVAIWAAIVYFTNREVGWVAWGVGGLVGLGVRLLAGENDGWSYGLIAAGIASPSFVIGKCAVVMLMVSNNNLSADMKATPYMMVFSLAHEVVRERQDQGKQVNFSKGKDLDTAESQADYPADVWKEAENRWAAFTPAEQAKQMEDRDRAFEELIGNVKGNIRDEGFRLSFSPFDLLWFGLAMFTAFIFGSGLASSED